MGLRHLFRNWLRGAEARRLDEAMLRTHETVAESLRRMECQIAGLEDWLRRHTSADIRNSEAALIEEMERRFDALASDIANAGTARMEALTDRLDQLDTSQRFDELLHFLRLVNETIKCQADIKGMQVFFPKAFELLNPTSSDAALAQALARNMILNSNDIGNLIEQYYAPLRKAFSLMCWRNIDYKSYLRMSQIYAEIANISTISFNVNVERALFLFIHGDPAGQLPELFTTVEFIDPTYTKWPDRLLVFYASYCELIGDMTKSEIIVRAYVCAYGEENLYSYASVAFAARRAGFKGILLEKAASIYDEIIHNPIEYYLNGLLTKKRTCIVGNAPTEIGRRGGGLIDSYDVVVRFNDYELNDEYIRDYGHKVTIWVSNEEHMFKDKRRGVNSAFVLATNIYCESLSPEMIDELYRYMTAGIAIVNTGHEVRAELARVHDILVASNGLVLAYLVSKVSKKFSLSDCYGVSFSQSQVDSDDWLRVTEHTVTFSHDSKAELRVANEIFSNR